MTVWTAGQPITAAGLNAMIPQIGKLTGSGQTISSTSPVPLGFDQAATVVSGQSCIAYAWLLITAVNGSSGEFRWTGPSTSLQTMGILVQQLATADAYQQGNYSTAASGGYNAGFLDTPTLAGTTYIVQLWGIFTFTASGTLALEAATSDSYTVEPGSYLRVDQQLT